MKTKEASQEVYLPSDVMASHGRDRSGWRFPHQKSGSGFEELPVPDIFSRSGTKTILDCRNCRHDRGRVGKLSKVEIISILQHFLEKSGKMVVLT